MNGDSNVNISDVTTLINYLLSHNWAAGARAAAVNATPPMISLDSLKMKEKLMERRGRL